ncbi:MAG: hypothetical protein AB2417_18535 [Clostridiaceae bacterium]
MIQQHYYTRDKKGVYSNTPGYDTVGKSINLEDDFIVDVLHNLCFYEAPSILAGEEDILKYPQALFCVNTEDNKIIIGQSVFAGKDYTGNRNRYFTHSYIISEKEREDYIENPEKIIYLKGFVDNYDVDKGKIIPEVLETRVGKNTESFSSIDEMFSKTGIEKKAFKKLITASFNAALYGKKIYIVLDCEPKDLNNISKEILTYLYRCIPFEVRRKIGFITYMKEPQNKDLINLMFLNKGSIKRLTTEIKAGYVFNFADNNFYLEDLDGEHSFTDFITDNIDKVDKLNDFFKTVDQFNMKNKLDIQEYDSITDFIHSQGDNCYIEDMEVKYKEFLNINKKKNNLNESLECHEFAEKDENSHNHCNKNMENKSKKYILAMKKLIKRIKNFCKRK